MIVSFGDKATEDLFHGTRSPGIRKLVLASLVRRAQLKLDLVNAAAALLDLRSPPGNQLEKLKGDLDGMHSIRINDQYRIIFYWTEEGTEAVQIVDYH